MKRTALKRSSPLRSRSRLRPIGARGKRQGSADSLWRCQVAGRDGGRCRVCGMPGTDAHHIFGKQAYPRLRHTLANGVLLCRAHHQEAHNRQNVYRLMFLQRLNPAQLAEVMEGTR